MAARLAACRVIPQYLYVWARQALRHSLAVGQPTPHEQRVLEQVSRRIGYRGDDQPYYDHTEAKKVESRGVEAILNAVVLTGLDGDAVTSDKQPLMSAAMGRLWDVQRPDGAWDWLDFGLEPFEAPDAVFQSAAMAAVAAGSPAARQASDNEAGRAGVAKLRAYLRAHVTDQRAFNRAWMLLAAARLDGLLNEQERSAIVTGPRVAATHRWRLVARRSGRMAMDPARSTVRSSGHG